MAALATFVNTHADKMAATSIEGVKAYSKAETSDQNTNAAAGLHNATINATL